MSKIKIRPLEPNDFPDWLPLWDGNNQGQRNEAVTTETWARLTDPDYPVFGLCAENSGKMAGILHYILHPTTGSIQPVCYMQDLYVDPRARQKGIGKALVQELAGLGKAEKWARLYWLAEEDNKAAQKLYKNLGVKLNFSLHVMPLN